MANVYLLQIKYVRSGNLTLKPILKKSTSDSAFFFQEGFLQR